jgi:hypothetical protein
MDADEVTVAARKVAPRAVGVDRADANTCAGWGAPSGRADSPASERLAPLRFVSMKGGGLSMVLVAVVV